MADPHSFRVHFGFELQIPTMATAVHIHGALPDRLWLDRFLFIFMRRSAIIEEFITRHPDPAKYDAATLDRA